MEDAGSVMLDLQLEILFLVFKKNNALSLSIFRHQFTISSSHTERVRGYFTLNALYKLPTYLYGDIVL